MFDPENVERLTAVDCWSDLTRSWISGEPMVVLSSDYDHLLELYRQLRKDFEHLQDSTDPRYDTSNY